MRQGQIGNCWFISAASALSEVKGRVEKIFLNENNEVSNAGIYALNFYTLGVPHTVVIDDYLPLVPHGNSYSTMYAMVGEDSSLFGPILEKAFAKYHGNFEHIIGGDAGRAVQTLYGTPLKDYDHSKIGADDLWTSLLAHDKAHDIIQGGTSGNNHFQQNSVGLA
jgi:hypothetical protein